MASLQKDHDTLNGSYVFELNRKSRFEHATTVLRRIINKLMQKSETSVCEGSEI